MPLKFGHRQKVLNPYLVDRELVGEGSGHLLAAEAEDGPRFGPHFESINDEQAVHPFEPGQKVETQGAAVHDVHTLGKPVTAPEFLHCPDPQGVVGHQGVAQPQHQDTHRSSFAFMSGFMNL